MDNEQASPQSPPPLTPYVELKKRILRAGLLSCSEQGFNIARGALCDLRDRLWQQLSALAPVDEVWDTPPLLRGDWAVRGVWADPPEAQWCHEEPGGHLLTPRPAMHLLSRLRWHPQDAGAWLLRGPVFRDERDTLPLYRQRCFTMLEYVRLGESRELSEWAEELMEELVRLSFNWDLPVVFSDAADGELYRTELELPETAPVPLARALRLPQAVLDGYGLSVPGVLSVGLGLERFCLAVLARHGVDPADWPV